MRVLFIFTFLISATYAASFGDTSGAKEMEVPDLGSFRQVEAHAHILFLSPRRKRGGIPGKTVRAYDPVGKKHYQKVIVGETYKAGLFAGFDYWRYVTVYNVTTVAERIAYLPYFEEDCFDSSWGMAQWGETRSLKVSLSSTLGAKALGLDTSVSISIESGVSFSSMRKVQATLGVRARHYPYKISDVWSGVTYIQTYNAKKKRYGYLEKLGPIDSWLKEYPYPFELDNQNVGFKVKREVLGKCDNYDPEQDRLEENILYIQ